MKRAFGYCRVSSAGQASDDRDGIPRQKESIRKYAAANDIRIVQWFEDAFTGTRELDHRPALQAMLSALDGNDVKLVVIEKLDRLARDLMIQESILKDLQRNGFELVSTLEPDLCSKDPTRVLMRQILGAFAEYEAKMIVLKLRGARQRARAKDPTRHEGRKCFGQHAGEAETVERIFTLRDSGHNLTQIAAQLMAESLPTRDGGVWRGSQISRILRRAS